MDASLANTIHLLAKLVDKAVESWVAENGGGAVTGPDGVETYYLPPRAWELLRRDWPEAQPEGFLYSFDLRWRFEACKPPDTRTIPRRVIDYLRAEARLAAETGASGAESDRGSQSRPNRD